jgi:hypothetical protein
MRWLDPEWYGGLGELCMQPIWHPLLLIMPKDMNNKAVASMLIRFWVVGFEIFTAVTMKNAVFGDMAPCGSCKNRHFRGALHLRLHISRKKKKKKNMWVRKIVGRMLTDSHWHVPPKCLFVQDPHGAMSQKTAFFRFWVVFKLDVIIIVLSFRSSFDDDDDDNGHRGSFEEELAYMNLVECEGSQGTDSQETTGQVNICDERWQWYQAVEIHKF